MFVKKKKKLWERIILKKWTNKERARPGDTQEQIKTAENF